MARRRGPGEGSIRLRADGRWEGRYIGVGRDGRRVRRSVFAKTRREVSEALARRLHDQRRGLPDLDERLTVADYLARWLAALDRQPSTMRRYEQLVRVHLVPALGGHRLAQLTPEHVEAMMRSRAASGLSPRTIHHLRAVLRAALNRAVKHGLVARNVATLADGPAVPHHEVAPLSPDEARLFLEAARGDRLEALYTVALALGLRQGEALGLRWSDVDLDAGELRVQVALQRVAGRPTLVSPKTRGSRRTIALPGMVAAALREHRRRQLEEQLWAGSRWQGEAWGLVFTSTIGTPLDGTNVTHRLQQLLKAAGLPRQRFHDLRHGCASLLLAQGVHPRVVMELLGHSTIALTMNTYSHVIPALQRDAADQMQAALAT